MSRGTRSIMAMSVSGLIGVGLERFAIVPKPGELNVQTYEQVTAAFHTNGGCALFEFTGALVVPALTVEGELTVGSLVLTDTLTVPNIETGDFTISTVGSGGLPNDP